MEVKEIEWIYAYYISEKSYLVHNFFYDNSSIETYFVKKKSFKTKETDFTTFERDLKVIINKKTNYSFGGLTQDSALAKRINSYVLSAVRSEENSKDSHEASYFDQNIYEERYANKIFEICSL